MALELVAVVRDASFGYVPHARFFEAHAERVRFAVNVAVFRGPEGLVVADPGPGDPSCWIEGLDEEAERMSFTEWGGLLRFLEKHGGPEAVAEVLLTHQHPDHACALFTREGRHERTFPRAVVRTAAPDEFARYCRAYLGRGDAYPLLPAEREGAETFASDKHAVGHTAWRVETNEGPLVLWGDYLPTATHLLPRFRRFLYDEPPAFLEGLLERSAAEGAWNLLFHDPRRALVRFGRRGGGYRTVEERPAETP